MVLRIFALVDCRLQELQNNHHHSCKDEVQVTKIFFDHTDPSADFTFQAFHHLQCRKYRKRHSICLGSIDSDKILEYRDGDHRHRKTHDKRSDDRMFIKKKPPPVRAMRFSVALSAQTPKQQPKIRL